MPLPGIYTTISLDSIVQPPIVTHSHNLVLIGESTSGTYMEPTYIFSVEQAIEEYDDGSLLRACKEAIANGAYVVYLMRINHDNETLNAQAKYDRLEEAYDILSTFAAHIVVPVDTYVDDTLSYATQLVGFLKDKEYQRGIGVLGVKAQAGGVSNQEYVSSLLSNATMISGFSEFSEGKLVDTGKNLCVVFSTVTMTDDNLDEYKGSGAIPYAALISMLESGDSPTNKPLLGVAGVDDVLTLGICTDTITLSSTPVRLSRYPESVPVVVQGATTLVLDHDYSLDGFYITGLDTSGSVTVTYNYDDSSSLMMMGYTVLGYSRRQRSVVPLMAVTVANNSTPWSSLRSTRIMYEMFSKFDDIFTDLIGEPVDTAEIDNLIENLLKSMQVEEKLKDYKYTLNLVDPYTVEISLTIVPIGEILSIQSNIRMSL